MKITQKDVAEYVGLDQSAISKILSERTRGKFSDKTVKKVFDAAEKLGYLHHSVTRLYRRSSERKLLELSIKIIVRLDDNQEFARGKAKIRDLNLSGMLITDVKFENKKTLPLQPCVFELEVLDSPLKGLKCLTEPVRFSRSEKSFGFGVKFWKLSAKDKDRIRTVLDAEKT